MIVSAGDKGWSAYCFRCGHGFVPYPAPSLQERMEQLNKQRQVEDKVSLSVALPRPMNKDVESWPTHCKVWLYKAGFTIPEIQKHGWYYCKSIDRVVLPVCRGSDVIFWQGRNCTDKHRPKYLAPSVDRSDIAWQGGQGSVLVLCEDILSAAKVSRHAEAWSIMGTKLPERLLARIVAKQKPVAVWLDPDSAGRQGAAKITNTLRSVGLSVRNIKAELDPKFYCNSEIKEILCQ